MSIYSGTWRWIWVAVLFVVLAAIVLWPGRLDFFPATSIHKTVVADTAVIRQENPAASASWEVAFLPDIHFHDIYGEYPDTDFPGLETATPSGVRQARIRSMAAQLQSTRLFNENYFALRAALDDIAARAIKYVALPGDFSDDGQAVHLRGLVALLNEYRQRYGMEFFAAPGNHDPVRPFDYADGKNDFLGWDGRELSVFSKTHARCKKNRDASVVPADICTNEIQPLGYEAIMAMLGEQGFYPQPEYHYYATPFSDYSPQQYSYEKAKAQAVFQQRQYEICREGSGGIYKKPDFSNCSRIADASYLVEPAEGLWLLSIDANVYRPGAEKDSYSGSGDAGYNLVLSHKTHLLEWIKTVVAQAKTLHKTLIAFSHFPMADYTDNQAVNLQQLFGAGSFQAGRLPSAATSALLAETGLRIHVAGHMHMNDTGIIRNRQGDLLVNIQAPSLAAYVPAYKLLRYYSATEISVETIRLDKVANFATLFPHYQREWQYLAKTGSERLWDRRILESRNYHEFTAFHLRELARLRFLPQEWPADLRTDFLQLNGWQLLVLAFYADSWPEQLLQDSQQKFTRRQQQQWSSAEDRARNFLKDQQQTDDAWRSWNAMDLSVDFYRLYIADQLALADISSLRINQYRILSELFNKNQAAVISDSPVHNQLKLRMAQLFSMLPALGNADPSDHFLINLANNTVQDLLESHQ